MRSRVTLGLTSVVAAAGAVLGSPWSAQATSYPTSPYSEIYPFYGEVVGTFTWYNRSVGVTGYVQSYCSKTQRPMQVRFQFFTGINAEGTQVGGTETRTTAECARRGYKFTQDGSDYPGGIRSVVVALCETNDLGFRCDSAYIYNR